MSKATLHFRLASGATLDTSGITPILSDATGHAFTMKTSTVLGDTNQFETVYEVLVQGPHPDEIIMRLRDALAGAAQVLEPPNTPLPNS